MYISLETGPYDMIIIIYSLDKYAHTCCKPTYKCPTARNDAFAHLYQLHIQVPHGIEAPLLTTVEPRITDDQANSDCKKPHAALNSQGDLKLKEAKGNKLLHFGTKLKVTGIIGTITEPAAVNSGGLRSTVDGTKCSKSQSSEPITIRGTPATGLNKGRHDHGEPVRDSFTHATCLFQATESIQQQVRTCICKPI